MTTTLSPFDAVMKFFDSYSRIARLYPSFLAFGPILWSAVALFPSFLENISHSVAFAVGASCIFYFLSSLSRSLGKRAEPRLLAQWDGWPTTTLLRHRDGTIDANTKARYHRALETLAGLKLPNPGKEGQDPKNADDLYRSATKKLIEKRRGPEYKMLHGENASYGFRRNLYGLKPLALAEATILIALTLFGWWVTMPRPYAQLSVIQTVTTYPYFPVLVAADLFYMLLWCWVTSNYVHQAAREYAEALFRTLDR